MEKYKIICIALAVLSFHIRRSQSRSLNDDESEHNISEKSIFIEDWTTECACFPKTVKGIPVSKFLPSYKLMDRLVVYFYRNKISGEITYYIPSWKKQINFPDLAFDIGDKLDTGTIDGIINLFDTAIDPERLQFTTVSNGIPIKNVVIVNPGAHLEIKNISTSYNQHKNNSGTSQNGSNQKPVVVIPPKKLPAPVVSPGKVIQHKNNSGTSQNGSNQKPVVVIPPKKLPAPVVSPGKVIQHKNNSGTSQNGSNQKPVAVIPPKELPAPVVSPGKDKKIITGVNTNHVLNLSLGNNQQPLLGTLNVRNRNLKPIEKQQNQQKPISGGTLAYLRPGKPETEGETIIINSPENQIEISKIPQNKKLVLPTGQQNQLIKDVPHFFSNNFNLAIDRPVGLGELVKYVLPGHEVLVSPSKSNNGISSSWINTTTPNKQPNLANIEHLLSKYNNPTFNNWFNKQIVTIRSQRPSMLHTINFHVLKLLLIKALHENGISVSENGDLRDSNGNILKMTNLKIRPILLGDPMDYQKLIDTKTCVIPYDLPYLEAVLVTLVYPPRILAIIPLGAENVFVSALPGKTVPTLCGQSKCHTSESSRSGLPKEEDISDISDNKHTEDNSDYLYNTEQKLEDPTEKEIPTYFDKIKSRNADTYMNTNTPEEFSLEQKNDDQNLPWGIKSSNSQNALPRGLTPSESNHIWSQLLPLVQSDKPRNDLNSILDNKDNDENLQFEEEFGKAVQYNEPGYYANDVTPINDYSYAARRNNLPFTIIDTNQDSLFQPSQIIYKEPQFGREVFYLDENGNVEGRKSLEDYEDVPPEIPQTPDEEDYDMLHIRIIGGNPATSSGTPVNSRGRSGLNS